MFKGTEEMNLETLDRPKLARDVKRYLYVLILKEHLPAYLEGKLDKALTKKITQAQFLRMNAKYIKAYTKQLEKRFNEMYREVLGNVKKTPKLYYSQKLQEIRQQLIDKEKWLEIHGSDGRVSMPKSLLETKFDVDQWLFSRQKWRGTFTEDGKLMTAKPLEEGGVMILDDLPVEMSFDHTDPRAIKWIAENAKNAGFSITNTQYERLRTILMESLADGLSIPKIRDRIQAALKVAESRAELIARTEVLKASNRGVLIGMQQSGVVEGKEWSSAGDKRVCPRCAEMDGATMPLDKPFFKLGEAHTFHGTDETPAPTDAGLTDVFDYEEIQHPPLHALCRCTLLAILKEV